MPRLQRIRITTAAALIALVFSTSASAQQDFSAVEIIPHHVAGSVYYLEGTLAALGRLIGQAGPDTKILPGHGVVSSREDVMGFRDMVLDVKARVAPMVESGMSYEELTAADPTAAYNDRYGNPDRFLRALYTELGGEL